MVETNYRTIRYKTSLPYNCIYYILGKNDMLRDDSELGLLSPERSSDLFRYNLTKKEVEEIQGFRYHFCFIRPMDFFEKTKQYPNGSTENLILYTLRDIFPIAEHGYYLVNLLPQRENYSDENIFEYDTLLVGIPDENNLNNFRSFSKIAAHANFKRMLGMNWEKYKQLELIEKQRQEYERSAALPSDGIFKFQTIKKRSDLHYNQVSKNKEQVFKEYMGRLSSFVNSSNHDYEQLMELMRSGVEADDNTKKFKEVCPIKVCYAERDNGGTDDYELLLSPPEDEPIICKFERFQTKVLYVFFLRHPEGISTNILQTKEYIEELAEIYKRLKNFDLDEVSDSILEEIDKEAYDYAKKHLSRGSIYQSKNDCQEFFDKLFIKPIASQYYIAQFDGKKKNGKYGISLDSDLITLDSPFDKSVIRI